MKDCPSNSPKQLNRSHRKRTIKSVHNGGLLIRITPAKVERVRLMQEVAVCPAYRKDGDGTIVKAAVYPSLLPHSPASASSEAYVIFDKCFIGMPYYRQESGLAQFGFKLPGETMANWVIYCARHYFYPPYERMHKHLVHQDLLHADETTCQVLREEGKSAESTSYMWIYLTGSDGLATNHSLRLRSGKDRQLCKRLSGRIFRSSSV